MSTNLKVVVGTPGTGKSYRLIQNVIKLEHQNKKYSVIVPTNVAKERILEGFRKGVNDGSLTMDQFYNTMVNIHVLQYNYRGEENVFIDEFSMFNIDDFYALLYKIMLVQNDVNIMAFGDSKQLQPVRGISPLLVLLRFNYNKFVDVDNMPFSEYSATKLYDNLKNMELDVPDNWRLAIDKIDLEVLHKNHRLEAVDGVTDYNDLFYQYVLENNVIDEDYKDNLIALAKQKYLIIVPIHKIGDEVDEILSHGLVDMTNDVQKNTEALSKIAPFVRKPHSSKVYCNPLCKIEYGFDSFVPKCEDEKEIEDFKFSFYVTSHATQGATVDNVAFYFGNNTTDKGEKNFYTNNMLYTALSRARYNSFFLGDKSVFLKMTNTYVETDLSFLNTQLQDEALDLTYQTIVNAENFKGKFSNKQIVDLYNQLFEKVVKNNSKKLNDIKLIDSEFKIKPYTEKKILGVMKLGQTTKIAKHYQKELFKLGYGFSWEKYVSDQRKKSGQIGGKVSKVKEWLTTLDSDKYQELKNDVANLPLRKFKSKWKHDRRAVEKNVVIFKFIKE